MLFACKSAYLAIVRIQRFLSHRICSIVFVKFPSSRRKVNTTPSWARCQPSERRNRGIGWTGKCMHQLRSRAYFASNAVCSRTGYIRSARSSYRIFIVVFLPQFKDHCTVSLWPRNSQNDACIIDAKMRFPAFQALTPNINNRLYQTRRLPLD